MEHEDRGEVYFDVGLIMKSEVWKGSTFQTSRSRLPGWKILIDDQRHFHRELSAAEKQHEGEHGEVILMGPPFRKCSPTLSVVHHR